MYPRKRFGQHFLHDASVIERIVAAIAPKPDDRLIEIGPGLGALTWPLLKRVSALDAVEIDWDAIRELKASALTHTSPGLGELRIHEADVLKFDFGKLRSDERPLRVVGNLPYNISTPLLFHLIEHRQHILDMHFMLQKEVVDRMAAQPNAKSYGRLTVMLAPWVRVEALFDVGPGAFRPPPRVQSSIVRLTPHASPPFVIADHDVYARVVAAAFAQRRKTLRNALKTIMTADAIERANVDPGARGETLSPAEFAALAAHAAPA
jgi:16S rRNA (adenine1518-N6/adenine1519-N6)-dimethyltransferase